MMLISFILPSQLSNFPNYHKGIRFFLGKNVVITYVDFSLPCILLTPLRASGLKRHPVQDAK